MYNGRRSFVVLRSVIIMGGVMRDFGLSYGGGSFLADFYV